MKLSEGLWHKATFVDRKFASFELVCGNNVIIAVGFSDDEIFEVGFGPKAIGMLFDWIDLSQTIEEGKMLALEDRN